MSDKGSLPKGSQCATDGAQHRQHRARNSKALDERRELLRQNGTFYTEKNGDRSNDIFALEAGISGQYAFPGGGEPSAHFEVYNNGTPEKPFKVIRFQGSQRGHVLPGNLNTEVFLPVHILRENEFYSKCTGEWACTQTAIFKYLTGMIDSTRELCAKEVEKNKEELLNSGSVDLRSIFTAKNGDTFTVALKKKTGEHGKILIAVDEWAARKTIRVVASSFAPITGGLNWFLPVSCLEYSTLIKVTSDEVFAQQCELHAALLWVLGELPEREATSVTKRELIIAPQSEVRDVVVLNVGTDSGPIATEPGNIDFKKSVRLTAPTLIAKIKEGKRPVLVHIGNDEQRVYLMRERTAGVQKIRLVKADDHSTLSAILEAHTNGVDVDVRNVLDYKPAAEIGDLANIKNARLHLTLWLNQNLSQVGYHPKRLT